MKKNRKKRSNTLVSMDGGLKKAAIRVLAGGTVLALSLGLSGCAGQGPASDNGTALQKLEGVRVMAEASYPEPPAYKNEDERWEMERNKQVPETFSASYDAFALETTAALFESRMENTVFSPLSLYYALAFSAMGSEGETKSELLNLLRYDSADALAEDCKTSYEFFYHVPSEGAGEYEDPKQAYSLIVANSIWADDSMKIKQQFADDGARYFYSDSYQADFSDPSTPEAMSKWVEERTKGLIAPEAKQIPENVALSIMNTVYFYDEWVDRFNPSATKEDTFTRADGTEVTCEFMNATMASHGFIKGERFTQSTLSLKNGSMEFYLPDPGIPLSELLSDAGGFQAMLEGEGERFMGEVVWKVPKFASGSSLNLEDTLRELGVMRAFDGDADFSGISDNGLFISKVIQDAHVGIDENGVEAAAFTQIDYSGAALPTGRAEMLLDRPFLYVIRNRGQILFIGICENPAA